MINGYWSDGISLGFGEAAAMALAIKEFGIVASNNLSDIESILKKEEIPILTFSMILVFCFELNLMSKKEINLIWQEIIKNTNQSLPKNSFDEYYDDLFEVDCANLLIVVSKIILLYHINFYLF